MKLMRNLGLGFIGMSLALGSIATLAPVATAAAPADRIVALTSAELKDAGFPRRPNTVAWGKGTATVSPHKASTDEPIIITGKAPKYAKPGTILTMERFLPSNRKGSGSFQTLAITATVRPDRSFLIEANLGRPGLWGYRVGYSTDSDSPEFIGFQFQATTTTG